MHRVLSLQCMARKSVGLCVATQCKRLFDFLKSSKNILQPWQLTGAHGGRQGANDCIGSGVCPRPLHLLPELCLCLYNLHFGHHLQASFKGKLGRATFANRACHVFGSFQCPLQLQRSPKRLQLVWHCSRRGNLTPLPYLYSAKSSCYSPHQLLSVFD
jgi:hypothetical protein